MRGTPRGVQARNRTTVCLGSFSRSNSLGAGSCHTNSPRIGSPLFTYLCDTLRVNEGPSQETRSSDW